MGSLISLPSKEPLPPPASGGGDAAAPPPPTKKRRPSALPPLIPAIPDDISLRILARLPRHDLLRLQLVCRSWRRALTGADIYDIRNQLRLSRQWLYILLKDEDDDNLSLHAVDPTSGIWQRLPPMPELPPVSDSASMPQPAPWWRCSAGRHLLAGVLASFRRWRSGAEITSGLHGCAAAALDGRLYVMGGMRRGQQQQQAAERSTWCYDARSNRWTAAAPMGVGRARCQAAALGNRIYALGGVEGGSGGGGAAAPLRSAEVYDPVSDSWQRLPDIPFAGAKALPSAILEDAMARPVATGAAAYSGKLWVPESLCSWPFFVDLGGEVWDPATEEWTEMPPGMAEGWPGKQTGTKLSVVLDDRLYALDPSTTTASSSSSSPPPPPPSSYGTSSSSSAASISGGGAGGETGKIMIMEYESSADSWSALPTGIMPVVLDSSLEAPYLLAGLGTGLHVVTKDIHDCVVVLAAEAAVKGGAAAAEWKVVARKKIGAAELVGCEVVQV